MATKLSLRQISDIDNLPFYFKKADEMDVTDNNIVLNFNENTSMSATSIGAGISIQDGDGVNKTVNLNIVNTRSLTSESISNTEYSGDTGYQNRAWITQLKDIVLSSNENLTDGLRVIKEKDFLDGGEF